MKKSHREEYKQQLQQVHFTVTATKKRDYQELRLLSVFLFFSVYMPNMFSLKPLSCLIVKKVFLFSNVPYFSQKVRDIQLLDGISECTLNVL